MPFYTSILNDGVDSSIIIGDNCRLNGVYIHAKSKIVIGNNCLFASGVQIIDSNGHETYSSDRTIGSDTPKEIKIGNNVWFCTNSIVLKGTIIGDNCVVTANSVAKGEYPADSIICGNPAVATKLYK